MAPICHPGPRYLEHQLVLFKGLEIGINEDVTDHLYVDNGSMYRVVFLTGPPDFQYQNEKQVAAN